MLTITQRGAAGSSFEDTLEATQLSEGDALVVPAATTSDAESGRVTPSDLLCLVALAALWGGSFLFMRVATPEFGPIPLIAVRGAIASLFLVPLLLARGGVRDVARSARPLAVVGVINSAIPFTLLALATLSVTAGFAAILNATAPFFAAIVAYLWLGQRMSKDKLAGLAIGFAGVCVLVWGRASFKAGGAGMAVAAGLGAGLAYGIAANYSRVYLAGVKPLVSSAASQVASAACLLPLALWLRPAALPSVRAWSMVGELGIFSTGIAFLLYFRLIARIGAARTVTVTFLIPVFAMLWGGLFLHEAVTQRMALGTAIVLTGTSLTTGTVERLMRREKPKRD